MNIDKKYPVRMRIVDIHARDAYSRALSSGSVVRFKTEPKLKTWDFTESELPEALSNMCGYSYGDAGDMYIESTGHERRYTVFHAVKLERIH